MKISCTQENLNKGLGIVGHMVAGRTTLPVLNNILLKVEKGRLNLAATDLEIGISTWIGAKVDKEGAVTVPARLFTEYVTTNTDKTINLELKETTLRLSSDHFKANIKGIEASEFPLIPEVKEGPKIEIQQADFKDGILKTVFACALDETRPVLSGVYLKIMQNKLKMVATDSYRLAEKTTNLASRVDKQIDFIVPGRTLAEVGRLIDGSLEQVEIMVGENQVQFKLGPTILISRLIEGSFPDYEQIIPKNTITKSVVKNKELQNAIKMASFFARDSANNIKLRLKKPKNLNIIAVSAQLGDNTSELQAEISGEDLEIAFNAKFILDCLNILTSEEVTLELAGSLSPGMLRSKDDKNYLYIIMPLKLEE